MPFLALATVSIAVGIQALHDRVQYHFENPSSWDTSFLVPHFFEQRYSANKNMLVMRAMRSTWELEVGVTPVQTARGSDYDTFYQPSGDIIVHGSTTDVSTRAWRAAQYVHSGQWRAGLAYSRDQSKFPSSLSTTSHTSPPSLVSSLSTTRESTVSEVFEVRAGFVESRELTPRWRLRGGIDAAPFTLARLTTHLPDKYVNQPIRFSATAFGASANVSAEWHSGRAEIVLSGELGRSWRYLRRSSFTRRQAGATILFGLGR